MGSRSADTRLRVRAGGTAACRPSPHRPASPRGGRAPARESSHPRGSRRSPHAEAGVDTGGAGSRGSGPGAACRRRPRGRSPSWPHGSCSAGAKARGCPARAIRSRRGARTRRRATGRSGEAASRRPFRTSSASAPSIWRIRASSYLLLEQHAYGTVRVRALDGLREQARHGKHGQVGERFLHSRSERHGVRHRDLLHIRRPEALERRP